MAFPETTLSATGSAPGDAQLIKQWATQHDPAGIVIGLPVNMDGTEGPQAHLCRTFSAHLEKLVDYPVRLWDERLSSFQADQVLNTAGVRGSRRKNLRDALAAQVILQSFLDAQRSSPEEEPSGG